MNGHNKVQDMLSDLQGRYTKLLSDFEKLKEYQYQINLLEKKLIKIMPHGKLYSAWMLLFPMG
ncbi:Chromosome segregation ATPase [Yersinia enterocolitica]|nr:Chromosome segregation ATPase [Yersinia enterocolitica]